ncbi:disease resistance protein RPM1 [Vigna unguiculata]|uniref:Disease resistance protein RPM1 n=1 Tax=Vigna unguiculata TaxID=3917 RepID=A0A4D6NN48_VIGUN|nr:disease resistance protein RPM1 [Vigna unguiculata]
MAEAVLELVLENLSSLVGKELALFLGFHDDLERLASLLTTIKATLEDAEHKQFSDVAIQIWLQKLKDAALTLDDIMDECGCELLGMEFQRIRGVSNKVQIFGSLSSFNPKHVAFRYKIAKKMRRISKRLEEIGEERTKFHFTETVSERSGDSDWRQTTSFITEPQVEILNAEDVGESVWNELYWRSFFQDIKTDECGKVKSFKIHDLVHDLAQFVAIDVCCVSKQNHVTTLSERIHHLSIYGKDSIPLHQVNSLRTYIKPSQRNYFGQICDDVLKCHSLRVLHYERWEPFIPSSIGHLKHLRYLNLSLGKFQTLPISVCKLWNLQILKLDYCKHLRKLPDNLVGLKGLQQLSLKGCFSLSRLPPHVGNLTSLRILNMYIVGKQRGSLLAELGPLKLKGDLLIKHMGKVKSVKDAKEANMFGKKLNKLRLSWDRYDEELELQENVEEILEVLQPDPKQLERVTVDGYKGAYFPQWMSSSSLHLLNFLELNDCGSCLKLPQLGKLPSLKIICLRNISNVKYLYEESDDGGVVFMSLELLTLRHLPNLTRISREGGENMFPHLSTLEIIECPKLLNVSAGFECFTCVKDLLITGCREKVEGVNEALRHMTALRKLTLDDLPNLESLPHCLGNLSLLHDLTIHNCSKLSEILNAEDVGESVWNELYWRSFFQDIKTDECGKVKSFKIHDLVHDLAQFVAIDVCCVSKQNHILKLDYCKHLRKLPDNLVGLKGLQQLSLKGCFSLSRLPPHVGNLTSLRILNMYIVGKQRGSLLAELGPLKLKGDLLIKHMGKVKSVKDAKEANMFGKKLNKLRLSWDRYDEELELQENVEEILEVLQPDPKQLERVTVDGYKGAYFPQWMSSSSLHLLNFLELNDCGSCLKLPQLGKLPSLKIICLRNISNVKYLYEESDDGGVVFMSLELLTLRHLPNLTRISREGGENMFPHLSTLEIIECPKLLNVSAGFECFTCVKDLLITGCREKVEGVNEALRHMTALRKLTLDDLPNLESLPHCLGNLSLLHDLTIHNCSKLRCLPTCLSRSLQYLTISERKWSKKVDDEVTLGLIFNPFLSTITRLLSPKRL